MLKILLEKFFGSTPAAPVQTSVKKEVKILPNSFFSKAFRFSSADTEAESQAQQKAAVLRVWERSTPRKLGAVRPVNATGAEYAQDAAGMKNLSAMDGAFGINNFDVPTLLVDWYGAQSFIGWQMCALLAQNWLIDKACTIPSKDAVRNGWELTRNDGGKLDPKQLDKIRELDTKYKVKGNLSEYVRMSRMFGIRVCMFLVNNKDDKYYEKPFNIDSVAPGTYRGMTQIDPYWISPELDMSSAADPINQHFYEPTWWNISGLRVHRTHLCVSIPFPVADVLKPTYFYGGIPLPQKIYERVYNAERCANEAPQLLMTKRCTVLNMDLSQAVANPEEVNARISAWTSLRDNKGVKLLGLDDTLQQIDTTLTDLDSTILTQYELVAAIADVPATRLLGSSPSGLNATGEYEAETYREFLESIQENELTPLLERHYAILVRSDMTDMSDAQLIPNWFPLNSPTDKEQAEIQLIKAQTDFQLIQAGAINEAMAHERITKDPDSGYSGYTDELTVPEESERLLEPLSPLEIRKTDNEPATGETL